MAYQETNPPVSLLNRPEEPRVLPNEHSSMQLAAEPPACPGVSGGVAVKVFGAPQVTVNSTPIKLSGRAATLLTYLALEGKPLHRTVAAQLLWPDAGAQGLRNLRVELTGLRQRGIELSPNRASSLSLRASTELDDLQAQAGEARARFAAGLAPPLQNFTDHGNPELALWAKRQRQRLTQCVNHLVSLGQRQREPVPLESPGDSRPLQWLADRVLPELQAFIQGARHPQLALCVGRSGSGRRECLELALSRLGLSAVEIPAAASLDQMHTHLLVNLTTVLNETAPQRAPDFLPDQGPGAADLSRLAPLLMRAGPLAVVVSHAERLTADGVQMIDFLMGLGRPLLVVAVTTPAGQARLEKMLAPHDQPGWFQEIGVPALTPEGLPAREDWPGLDLGSDARFEIIRQTEGFLGAVRCQLPISVTERGRLGRRLQRTLHAELAAALGEDLEPVQALTLLPGPFSEVTALGVLSGSGLDGSQVHALLKRAVQVGVLERVDSAVPVRMPQMHARLPDTAHLLCFRSELQRAALASSLDASDRQKLKRSFCVLPPVLRPSGPAVALRALPAAPSVLGPHETAHLPGGYALLARATGWTVLRLGAGTHAAPRLELRFTAPAAAQRWQMGLRLQRLTPDEGPAVHVLSGASTSSRQVEVAPWSQLPEANGWTLAGGTLTERHLTLAVQASDLVLHLTRPEFL